MAFLTSLCCSSGDRSSKLEVAEARHARLVAVTNNRHNTRPLPQRWDMPLEDSPPDYEDIAQQPLLDVDEKQHMGCHLTVQSVEEDAPPPPVSSRSSVVSVPSTQMTDLTAAQTGESIRTTSQRHILERSSTRGSLPPYSYYSRRSPSPASTAEAPSEGGRDAVWVHPVMASNWLEVLRHDTLTQNAQSRDGRAPNGNARGGGAGPG